MVEILRALWKHAVELVTGTASFILLLVGLLMSDPTTSKASWIGAYLSGLVAAVSVLWKERRVSVTQFGRLALKRVRGKGEELLSVYNSFGNRPDPGVFDICLKLIRWRQECECVIKKECPRLWVHFADLTAHRDSAIEALTQLWIKRIDEAIEALDR